MSLASRLREFASKGKVINLAAALDEAVGSHLLRMAQYSALIGHKLGLGGDTVHVLEVAARMHDIGKIGVPNSILTKEGPLTASESAVMRTHPRIGYDILKGSRSKYFGMGAIIALGHHEKYDGTGYPNGLYGEDIPIVARVVAVADVFDALMSERPYKRAWARERSMAYLRSQRGKHFDPACVDALLDDVATIESIQEDSVPEAEGCRDVGSGWPSPVKPLLLKAIALGPRADVADSG